MKKIFLIISFVALSLLQPCIATADEGMWMVNLLNKGLMAKMKNAGLKLPAGVIYDENAVSLSDAVVALDFGCTGSMISEQGLLITNHHCAYADVHAISTPEHNYLEDGFWAMQLKDEVPIPGKGIYFLRKVLDVTDEVNQMQADAENEGKVLGSRKLSFIIEKKYSKETGYEASLASMWRGEKYYLYLYEVYKDVRLVAAPPVSIAAFGGDTDNWEWPQHKGDFAMYRVYADKDGHPAEYSPENIPLVPRRCLKISTEGVKKGDFTMIMGYPGRTDRYASSFKVHFKEKITDPITTTIRGHQMEIMDKWMNTDPVIRLIYSDKFFSLSNVQEYGLGEILTYRRYKVQSIREKEEQGLQDWINSEPGRKSKWGNLLSEMSILYSSLDSIDMQITTFRETLVRGTQFFLLTTRVNNMVRRWEKEMKDSVAIRALDDGDFIKASSHLFDGMNMEVEKELFDYGFKLFLTEVGREYWGDYIRSMYDQYHGDASKMLDYLYANSYLTDKSRFDQFINEKHTIAEFEADPMYCLMHSCTMSQMNQYKNDIIKKCGDSNISDLEKQYTNALFEMRQEKGMVQYPDANSTMRITYGTVGPINPSDGIYYSEFSTTQGIIDKYNPDDYEFTLKERQLNLLESQDWGPWADKKDHKLHTDFISNNDITGGNSGSPILNAKGELIGLAFDGNKESLCGDTYFHPEYNKCVNVDIRYVLWILDRYAGMERILEEIL